MIIPELNHKYLLFCVLVELILFVLTYVLLVQPKFIYGSGAKVRGASPSYLIGLVFFCLLFCWSLLLGAVMTILKQSGMFGWWPW